NNNNNNISQWQKTKEKIKLINQLVIVERQCIPYYTKYVSALDAQLKLSPNDEKLKDKFQAASLESQKFQQDYKTNKESIKGLTQEEKDLRKAAQEKVIAAEKKAAAAPTTPPAAQKNAERKEAKEVKAAKAKSQQDVQTIFNKQYKPEFDEISKQLKASLKNAGTNLGKITQSKRDAETKISDLETRLRKTINDAKTSAQHSKYHDVGQTSIRKAQLDGTIAGWDSFGAKLDATLKEQNNQVTNLFKNAQQKAVADAKKSASAEKKAEKKALADKAKVENAQAKREIKEEFSKKVKEGFKFGNKSYTGLDVLKQEFNTKLKDVGNDEDKINNLRTDFDRNVTKFQNSIGAEISLRLIELNTLKRKEDTHELSGKIEGLEDFRKGLPGSLKKEIKEIDALFKTAAKKAAAEEKKAAAEEKRSKKHEESLLKIEKASKNRMEALANKAEAAQNAINKAQQKLDEVQNKQVKNAEEAVKSAEETVYLSMSKVEAKTKEVESLKDPKTIEEAKKELVEAKKEEQKAREELEKVKVRKAERAVNNAEAALNLLEAEYENKFNQLNDSKVDADQKKTEMKALKNESDPKIEEAKKELVEAKK
ncbi:MAG: hypothetical protein P8P83_05205, partial [Rickettsiaceae bacterium]|nr:hypothetical protein [Rickettsiaceae bacterium]